MGFLSGVLEAVKDENEVTTYDTDPTKNINTVITTLNNNIGSGRAGLAASVDAVKGWLEGYEIEHNGKLASITGPIYGLKTNLETEITKFKKKDLKDPQIMMSDEEYGKAFNTKNVERVIEHCLLQTKTCIKDIFEDSNSGFQALIPDAE
ncbi:hypothetical protein, conserved [Babesia bigemina]|uniref:Uncharacterized protein n=1 Tax=Babesia bigemina TaxID=5866 RepID=A0A061BKV6_BABBI|nr:hypothetical protein, conserved [Babesia bigemina]CDR71560.1 hypothetical protein, conserved [Babesia bigemina]|eukprot:XP_012770506.1 hypothetical protein, conserved [Babesia bigemina]